MFCFSVFIGQLLKLGLAWKMKPYTNSFQERFRFKLGRKLAFNLGLF